MENPEIILSIVVPVYNVSQYLPKCLDSLLNQDINSEEYEIIIINDGSTDNSGEIARQYADNHPNIILINQENQGLSGARNSGIHTAQGKYIQFVDSDDFLEPNVEKSLIYKMERDNLDILRFKYQNVNEKYEVFQPNKYDHLFIDYSDSICDGITFLNERLGYKCYVVQFLIKTDIVKSLPLFREGIYFEDTEWTPRILTSATRITSTDAIVYNYLVRQGSITKAISQEKKIKLIEDSIGIIENMKRQMVSINDTRWHNGMIAASTITILSNISNLSLLDIIRYIKRLKSLNIFPISDYHLNPGALNKRNLINRSPFLFCFLVKVKSRLTLTRL